MAAQKRGGGGWSIILFFAVWVGLVMWWIVGAPAAGTAMTVVKVLVLIPGLIGLAVAVVLAFVIRKLKGAVEGFQEELAKGMGPEIDEAARKILDMQEALWGGPHEYRRVEPSEFEGLDGTYYDEARLWLEARDFQFLADVENLTASRVFPKLRTFIRVMAGDGGAVTAAVYQLRLEEAAAPEVEHADVDAEDAESGGEATDADVEAPAEAGAGEEEAPAAPRKVDALEFETELEDGSFLVTNALADKDRMPAVEGVTKLRLPDGTSPEKVLAEHRRRVAESAAAGRSAKRLVTFEQVMDSQHRMHALKCAHQRRIGFLDDETLARIEGKGKVPSVFSRQIVKRAKELYAERQAAREGGPDRTV